MDNKDSWKLPVTSHQKEIQIETTNVQTPRGRKGSEMNWEIGIDFYTKCYIQSSQLMRTYYRAQRTLFNVPRWPKREGSYKKRGSMYTYGWFTLLYSGNEYNILRQLYSNNFCFSLKSGAMAHCVCPQLLDGLPPHCKGLYQILSLSISPLSPILVFSPARGNLKWTFNKEREKLFKKNFSLPIPQLPCFIKQNLPR